MTSLDYSIHPAAVPYSTEQQRSIVTFTVVAKNNGPDPVDCSYLRVAIPTDPVSRTITLTTDPTTIAVSVGESTPWAIWTPGDARAHAVPLPPATGLAPNATAEFVFANVVVNTMPGTVQVEIGGSSGDPPQYVPIKKDRPVTGPGTRPEIRRFTVTPAAVARGGRVRVEWEVDGAETCVLAPGPVTLPSPGSGAVDLPVPQTTEFTLTALGTGGEARRSETVTVMPVRIDGFTASLAPDGSDRIKLRWQTSFAASCSIDNGIGPVPPAGEVLVAAGEADEYTLTANGLDAQRRRVSVPRMP